LPIGCRPALQRLLDVIRSGQVDTIVVYKVDRLTRSLVDFAKLVELSEEHNVTFVSVRQSFNTTTSMGRLTLNMLLSFAQFEREVTGERIRDKIPASKKRGIWVGGVILLGYRVEERKLLIDETEAAAVQLIFDRYLALGSLPERSVIGNDRIDLKLEDNEIVRVPWSPTTNIRHREIIGATTAEPARPMKAEARVVLLRSIAMGRRWLDQMSRGTIASMDAIALREGCSKRQVERTIASAFLSPEIVKAAAEALAPRCERQGPQRRSNRVVAAVAGAWIERRLSRAPVTRIRCGHDPGTSQV
jgi:hypothetical protein